MKVEALEELLTELVDIGFEVYGKSESEEPLDIIRSLTIVDCLGDAIDSTGTIRETMTMSNDSMAKSIEKVGLTPEKLMLNMMASAIMK